MYAEQDDGLVKSLNTRWDKVFPTEQVLKDRATAKFGEVDEGLVAVPVHRVSVWDTIFNRAELEDLADQARRLEEKRRAALQWEAWCGQMVAAYGE